MPTVRCTDHEDELDELRRSDYRYVIVPSPETDQGRRLRMLGEERTAAILVARLGRTSSAEVSAGAAARRRARPARARPRDHLLGPRGEGHRRGTGFAAPLRMHERPTAARTDGAVAAVGDSSTAL